jgi:hypothetical protein
MHAMYEIILQGYGWEQGWTMLQRIARNVRHFSGGASQIGKEVALGELIYGIAIDTYAGDIIRTVGHERLGYTLPRDFAAINGDAIGMLKGAPNPVVGSAFIEFLLSEAGQRIWFAKKGQPGGPRVFELGKLSVLPSLYGNVESASVVTENPFSMKNVLTYDAATAASRWTLVNDLFGVFIIDLHQRIARVADVEQLRGIPISELASQQLLSSGSWGSDQGVRTEMLQKWSAIARQNIPESPTPLGRFKALPGIIFCLLLIALVVRRAFSRTLTKTGPRNFSVK